MRKMIVVAALIAVLALALASTAFAQDYDYSYDYYDYSSYVCEDMVNRIWTGDPSLTAAELLSCGKSPEAIGARPNIGGPHGVGRENECSYLPQGSPESVACFEWLIASMGY